MHLKYQNILCEIYIIFVLIIIKYIIFKKNKVNLIEINSIMNFKKLKYENSFLLNLDFDLF